MRRLLLQLKFDGSSYHGWQVQNNANTVQKTLHSALLSLTDGKAYNVTGCSRTDSGVHANAYYCHFDTDCSIPAEKFPTALNAKLPDDISAISCKQVPDNFHARYSAKGKEYIYKFYVADQRDPFLDNYALRLDTFPDIQLLNNAAKHFIGTHDFSAFCASGDSVADHVRTVYDCRFDIDGNNIVFRISGNGFLYNMVRIIVGTLLDVANGKLSCEDIPSIIESCDRTKAGKTAGAFALYLNEVYY